jgi:hypothetical protein
MGEVISDDRLLKIETKKKKQGKVDCKVKSYAATILLLDKMFET